jgi:hypothetical protein
MRATPRSLPEPVQQQEKDHRFFLSLLDSSL